MKNIISVLLLSLITILAWGKDVSLEKAKNVAKTHYAIQKRVALSSIETSLVRQKSYVNTDGSSHIAYYVLAVNQNQGFVIVSGDDKTIPVLGYVDHGVFDYNRLPNGLKKLMFNYAKEVKSIARDFRIRPTSSIQLEWRELENGTAELNTNRSSVAALMTTEWKQSSGGYNDKCPGGTPVGCVATATAQIMKYHNHPVQGNGSHSYNHNDYGTLSANFGATTYDWANMPSELNSSSTQVEKDAISTLMYHIGVGLDMNYSPGSSGAFSREVPALLKDYFSYDNAASFIKRSHFSLASWKSKIKGELDLSRVVYHSGFCASPQAGHAFVVDGYDTDDKFHLNWGWGGYADGYFEINNLNPGSTYTFNDSQSAIVKIKPLATNTDIRMFGNFILSSNVLPFNSPLQVSVDIANYGNITYNGGVKASLFDLNETFVGNIEILPGVQIQAGDYETVTFTTSGMTIPPGNYRLGVYVQNSTNNTWMLVAEDGYINPINVSINGTNPQGLISNGNISITPSTIEQNNPFQIEYEILNNNTTDFNGEISMDLHQLNGDWIDEIEHNTYSIPANGTETIVINHTGLSNDPGSYRVVIWHKPTGGSWEIIEDGNYPNSQAVDIVGLDFTMNSPDIYENNNTEALAYEMPDTWLQNELTFSSTGSNVHSVTADSNDYYKVELEAGYSYKVYAKVRDNYNTQPGTFSNDVVFNVYDGANWTSFYDDIEMDTLRINNVTSTQDLLINVVPFFYNDLGTYELDVTVIRAGVVSVSENKETLLSVYPNPVSSILNVDFNGGFYESVIMTTIEGKVIKTIDSSRQTELKINLYDVAEGVYYLNLNDGTKITTKRISVIK